MPSKNERPKTIGVGGALGVLVFLAAIAALNLNIYGGILVQARSVKWPTVTGHVVESYVMDYSAKRSRQYRPVLRYEYAVNGRWHVSERIRYHRLHTSEEVAHRVVDAHPPGRAIRVYHDPTSPGEALLRPGVRGHDLFLALFTLPFNIALASAAVAAWQGLRRALPPRVRFNRRVRARRGLLVVRLPRGHAAGVAATAMLIASVALLFLFALTTADPPLPLAALALVLVGVVGGVAFFRAIERGGDGGTRFVVDRDRRRILLPFARWRPDSGVRDDDASVVAFDDVESVHVEKQERGRRTSRSAVYVPRLRVRAGKNHPKRTVHLGAFADEDEAKALREWLLAQLKTAPPK